jgi:hypothetical protein
MDTGAYAGLAVRRALNAGADPAAAAREYAALLARNIRPELLWSDRLRWVLFAAMRRLGAGPIRGFVRTAPGALAAMVHGRRSFRLLLRKRWDWGPELSV